MTDAQRRLLHVTLLAIFDRASHRNLLQLREQLEEMPETTVGDLRRAIAAAIDDSEGLPGEIWDESEPAFETQLQNHPAALARWPAAAVAIAGEGGGGLKPEVYPSERRTIGNHLLASKFDAVLVEGRTPEGKISRAYVDRCHFALAPEQLFLDEEQERRARLWADGDSEAWT